MIWRGWSLYRHTLSYHAPPGSPHPRADERATAPVGSQRQGSGAHRLPHLSLGVALADHLAAAGQRRDPCYHDDDARCLRLRSARSDDQ